MSQPRIFGSIFSAVVLAALTLAGPGRAAAEDCLAGPNGSAPQGRHWHYHLDRVSHRKCWHLSAEGAKAGQSAGKPAAESPSGATPTQVAEPQPWVAPPVQAMPGAVSAEEQPIWNAMSPPQTADASVSGSVAAALGAGVPAVAGVPVTRAAGPAQGDPGQASGPGPASSPIATGAPIAAATAEAAPSPDPSATATMSLPTVGSAASAPETMAGEPQPVGRHHSVATIGGALALATGMGLAISGWLVRRRNALQHRDAAEHERDGPRFRDDPPPFPAPGPDVFRPRRRAPAELPVMTDEEIAEMINQAPGEEPRRVRVEELEETLRDVMQALRRSAA